jgi:hypothetical protein
MAFLWRHLPSATRAGSRGQYDGRRDALGDVTQAVRRSLGRLLGRKGPDDLGTFGEVRGSGDDDAYTLFEGTTLRLHDLSTERLEDLRPDPGLLPGAFRIRVARSRDSREQAGSLVKRRYSSRGYQLSSGKAPDPCLFTFVAYNSGDLVGTVSLRLDSSKGLTADELYKEEIDALRGPQSRLCEFTRLAIDVNAGSKSVLAGLFHTAYLFAYRVRAYESAVIEVNPRHVVFYERALGFRVIGSERLSPRVNAPAVLLCVQFQTVAEGVAKYAGRPDLAGSTHSLFPYGFPPKDEEGILGRLRAFSESGGKAIV